VEARLSVALSPVYGSPGMVAVSEWPFDDLVLALLVIEASEGQRRYEAVRQIAADSVR
jgi:hypothetical protein